MSFCRITGRARNLPKPNFFPIIPPISPADARRLCRITGKRMDDHNYVPLIEIGRQPECVKCNITGKAGKDGKSKEGIALTLHQCRNDFKYVTPILKKEVMEKSDQRAFEDLQKLLKTLQKNIKPEDKEKIQLIMSVDLHVKDDYTLGDNWGCHLEYDSLKRMNMSQRLHEIGLQ